MSEVVSSQGGDERGQQQQQQRCRRRLRLRRLCQILALVLSAASAAQAQQPGSSTPLCSDSDMDSENIGVLVPPFAAAATAQEFEAGWNETIADLRGDLTEIVRKIAEGKGARICFHPEDYYKPMAIMSSWATFFRKHHNVDIVYEEDDYMNGKTPDLDLMKSCDLEIVWGVKSAEFFALRRQQSFAHTIILGEPLIQELKPAKSRTLWTHAAWDYPNGYGITWKPSSNTRWKRYLDDCVHVHDWIPPRPEGTILILGQLPTDLSLVDAKMRFGSIDNAYRYMVDSIKSQLPNHEIVYLAHPQASDPKLKCRLKEIEGVTVRSPMETDLSEELKHAAVVVTISSASATQAILRGVPVISMSSASPVWDVSCHDFSYLADAVNGSACRDSRKQWTFNLANTMWSLEDIESGRAFEYLLKYSKTLSNINVEVHKKSKRHSGIEIIRKFENEAIGEPQKGEEQEEQHQQVESSIEHHEDNGMEMAGQASQESTGSSIESKEPETEPEPEPELISARDDNSASQDPQTAHDDDDRTVLPEAASSSLDVGRLLDNINLTSVQQHLGRTNGTPADVIVQIKSTVSLVKNSTASVPLASNRTGNDGDSTSSGSGPLNPEQGLFYSTTLSKLQASAKITTQGGHSMAPSETQGGEPDDEVLEHVLFERLSSILDVKVESHEASTPIVGQPWE